MSENTGGADTATTGPSPRPKASNLVVRIATAAILAPLVLLLLFRGPAWGWALFLAVSSAQVGWEMLAMTHPKDRVSRGVGALMAAGVSMATYLSVAEPRIFFTTIIAALVVGAMLPLVRLGDIPTAALRTLGSISAPLYVGVLLSTLSVLRARGEQGPYWVLFALLIAWMGDTGGYVFGRIFGRTKLYEAVSPKKTREGLVGSVVFSVLACVAGSLTFLTEVPVLHAAILGFVGAVLGMMGDLVESLLKRSTGVKDSGSILPGHGGLFDRVDALLVVGPIVLVYALWFQ